MSETETSWDQPSRLDCPLGALRRRKLVAAFLVSESSGEHQAPGRGLESPRGGLRRSPPPSARLAAPRSSALPTTSAGRVGQNDRDRQTDGRTDGQAPGLVHRGRGELRALRDSGTAARCESFVRRRLR